MTAQMRRRPAVSAHPLVAVPAATCARQLPDVALFRGHGGAVVHALAFARPLCQLRVRRLDRWAGTPPLRLCSLCSQALTTHRLGRFWSPTRVELAELHLHAADQLVADVRKRLADIRSAAIADGSALVSVEALPTYRASRGVPDGQPVPPLATAVILGQVLERVAPEPVVVPAADEQRQQDRADELAAARQHRTDRVVTSSARRRDDFRAAKAKKRGQAR